MGVAVMSDDDIKIGKFTGDKPTSRARSSRWPAPPSRATAHCGRVLAETEPVETTVKTTAGDKKIVTRRLGPVGGRIVAETLVGHPLSDSQSFVNVDPLWQPSMAVGGVFGLRELIAASLGG